MKPEWVKVEPGWYVLAEDPAFSGVGLAAVMWEGSRKWCVYIDKYMPPGDSQHKTMREAKAEAERRVGHE